MSCPPLAVIAGVGPGIGLAVARKFADEGFSLALIARGAEALAGHAAALDAAGRPVPIRSFPADLSNPATTAETFARIADLMGPAEVLVYNAARWNAVPAMALAPADFAADLALGVTGALVAAQAVYPGMKERGRGTMLFTGGGLALRPEFGAGVASLTAAKSALRGFVHALAKEIAPDGIHAATVTIAGTVAPGTPFDPDLIAEAYWRLHAEAPEHWSTEIVFTGHSEA